VLDKYLVRQQQQQQLLQCEYLYNVSICVSVFYSLLTDVMLCDMMWSVDKEAKDLRKRKGVVGEGPRFVSIWVG
jgi:hypothetical protein